MANENLKRMLELSKTVDAVAKNSTNSAPKRQSSNNYITNANADVKMAELDEMVFGKYEKPKNVYNAEDELERIKNRTTNGVQVTNPILQEVLNNPYSFDIDKILEDSNPKMKQLEEKLIGKNYGSGIENAIAITKTIDESDKKNNEIIRPNEKQNVTVDYGLIKTIVESVINEKLENMKATLLTESVNNKPSNNISMIMLGENFTFVDSEGNMYKCGDLKYVGKAKMKSNK